LCAGCRVSAERYADDRALKLWGEWRMDRRWKEGKRRMEVVGSVVFVGAGPAEREERVARTLLKGYRE
jgi:hypothetical protein